MEAEAMNEYFDVTDIATAQKEKEMDLCHLMRKAAQADKQHIITLEQQLAAKDAEIEHIKADKEGLVCGDCDGSGWLENREDGRYPCTCMTEAEPYQILQERLAEFKHGQDAYQQLFNNEKAENIWLHKQLAERDTEVKLLRDALAKAKTQSAIRLEGLCKCGVEKDQLYKQVKLLRDEIEYHWTCEKKVKG